MTLCFTRRTLMRLPNPPQGMATEGTDCGPLYDLYRAARADDEERVREIWDTDDRVVWEKSVGEQLETAIENGDTSMVETRTADLLFVDEEPAQLDGIIASLGGDLLHGLGYLASFVLFFGANSRKAVVNRLRWAYRRVGVKIADTESTDGIERTVFRCPYRDVGADRYGTHRVCHDVLDRVDDGYVTYLARHRGIEYERPRRCTGSDCCYSEVGDL